MAEPHRESQRKGVANFKAGAESAGSTDEIEQLVVTFNAAMGEIVKVERVDTTGKREELAEEECANGVHAGGSIAHEHVGSGRE